MADLRAGKTAVKWVAGTAALMVDKWAVETVASMVDERAEKMEEKKVDKTAVLRVGMRAVV